VIRPLTALMAVALVLSGCTAAVEPDEPERPSPFAGCQGLTGSAPVAAELPDVALPCFTGGGELRVRDLRGPAVINLWASWCGPCREELPVFQGLADRAEGRFAVIGVNGRDSRAAATDFATDRAIRFPTLFDPQMLFADKLGVQTLPATVFIDADGGMYVHRAVMDVDQLIEQTRKHTGVTVTR
jgi:cytochrome c biogenesis protein CcmG/thiol:disulfide interchange protein DsbE